MNKPLCKSVAPAELAYVPLVLVVMKRMGLYLTMHHAIVVLHSVQPTQVYIVSCQKTSAHLMVISTATLATTSMAHHQIQLPANADR